MLEAITVLYRENNVPEKNRGKAWERPGKAGKGPGKGSGKGAADFFPIRYGSCLGVYSYRYSYAYTRNCDMSLLQTAIDIGWCCRYRYTFLDRACTFMLTLSVGVMA